MCSVHNVGSRCVCCLSSYPVMSQFNLITAVAKISKSYYCQSAWVLLATVYENYNRTPTHKHINKTIWSILNEMDLCCHSAHRQGHTSSTILSRPTDATSCEIRPDHILIIKVPLKCLFICGYRLKYALITNVCAFVSVCWFVVLLFGGFIILDLLPLFLCLSD